MALLTTFTRQSEELKAEEEKECGMIPELAPSPKQIPFRARKHRCVTAITAYRSDLAASPREAALCRYIAASARARSSFIVSFGRCSAKPNEASMRSF